MCDINEEGDMNIEINIAHKLSVIYIIYIL